jgi:hypothetical protein
VLERHGGGTCPTTRTSAGTLVVPAVGARVRQGPGEGRVMGVCLEPWARAAHGMKLSEKGEEPRSRGSLKPLHCELRVLFSIKIVVANFVN